MSHCDLRSKGTLSRGWTSPVPLLLGEQTTNTFWQAPQRLAPHTHPQSHTHKYTKQCCPHSRRNKSSSPTIHTCLERRCSNACFLHQTASLVTGSTFSFGLSGSMDSPHSGPGTATVQYVCVYMHRLHGIWSFKGSSCLQSLWRWCWIRQLLKLLHTHILNDTQAFERIHLKPDGQGTTWSHLSATGDRSCPWGPG